MKSKEWILRISRLIFLAGRKLLSGVDFCPETVRDRAFRFSPSMQLASDITAHFNPHPATAVVVDAIHGIIHITQSVGVAHHGVPLFCKVTPVFRFCRQANIDRARRAAFGGVGTIASRQHGWNVVEVTHYHLIAKYFPLE